VETRLNSGMKQTFVLWGPWGHEKKDLVGKTQTSVLLGYLAVMWLTRKKKESGRGGDRTVEEADSTKGKDSRKGGLDHARVGRGSRYRAPIAKECKEGFSGLRERGKLDPHLSLCSLGCSLQQSSAISGEEARKSA